MEQRPVIVGELLTKFHFVLLCGDEASLDRPIVAREINRPGPEILGYFEHTDFSRIQFIGHKEQFLLTKLTEEQQRDRFEKLLQPKTPAIIITQGQPCPPILHEIAKRKNFPILLSPEKTSFVSVAVTMFLTERLAPATSIHATLIEVMGSGVLLTGKSGIGKSEIALELIKRGHRLVADDRVDLVRSGDEVLGHAPDILRGLIEVRGIGLVNVTRMFGITALKERQQVDYLIHLVNYNPNDSYDRLGAEIKTQTILDLPVPSIEIPVTSGRSMADLVEVAVMNMRLKESGFSATDEFENRYQAILARGGK